MKGLVLRLPFLLCAVVAILGGCGSTNTAIPQGIEALPAVRQGETLAPPLENYRIGALDELSVNVFRESELSVDRVVVDVAGNINLPVVGPVIAYGRTVDEIRTEVTAKLNDRYLRNAEVAVSVIKPTSYVFTIEGEVEKPGTYSIPGQVTLLQAVAIGEGPTNNARLSDVFVFRRVSGQRYAARFNLKDIRTARADDPQLLPGDTVVVGYSTGSQIYRDIIAALPGLATVFIAFQ